MIKLVLLSMVMVLSLTACTKPDSNLDAAIQLSRDGLSALSKANAPDVSAEKKVTLNNDAHSKIAQAKELYQTLIAQSPENGLYLNNYGWLQMRSGDLTGAQISFNKAINYRDSIRPEGSLEINIKELQGLLNQAH